MTEKIFKNIPFNIRFEELYQRLHVKDNTRFSDMIKELADEGAAKANLKGMYKSCYIDEKGKDFIIVEGVKLTSRILRKNVDKINKIFLYIATCGYELSEWCSKKTDLLENFIADAIQEHACRIAADTVIREIDEKFKLENPSSMNPGSLADWPIFEQDKLFTIAGNGAEAISVSINENYLMQPTKSLSGIRFSSEVTFCNCRMCPRENCPTRKAEYTEQHNY
ncbi:MAG: hypothetical protein K9L78_02775 [Victivallales bacterium]|nr:hypothetical protein [Victivallales bacterium]MCF7889020.1 hypothetical protein [Victivallales bacterium]